MSPASTVSYTSATCGPEVVGEQRRDRLADDLGLEVAEDALGAAVPGGDPALPGRGPSSASLDASAKASRMARRSLAQSGQFAGAASCSSVSLILGRNGTAAGIGSVPGRAWGMLPLTPSEDHGRHRGRRRSRAGRRPGQSDLARAALALARRFAAGATMWCLAPAWPEHARHVAVEFVHPVIVGKRALPAVSVDRARSRRRAAGAVAGRRRRCRRRPGRRPGRRSPAMRARRRGGATTSGSAPAPPAAGRGRPRALGRRATGGAAAPRRPPRAAVPRAVGADPRVLRAPRAAHAAGGRRASWTTACVTCSDEGRLARSSTVPEPTVAIGPHGRRVEAGRHDHRRRRCTRATSCSCTPARRSPSSRRSADA